MNPDLANDLARAADEMASRGEAQETATPAQTDGRSRTSKENGKKGGRPSIDWNLAAQAFQAQEGRILWRKGLFYRYTAKTGCYEAMTEGELGAYISGYLRRGGGGTAIPRYSPSAEAALVKALRSGDTSETATSFTLLPPVFLSTGEPATHFMAFPNGLLDVEKAARGEEGALSAHTDDYFSTLHMPYRYDQDAQCPRFDAALRQILPDEKSRLMLQMMAGLLLIPDTSYNVAFILYGEPGSGKSTVIRILTAMLGISNVCSLPMDMMGEKHSLHRLTTTLANFVDDSPIAGASRFQTTSAIEGQIKKITTGGLVHCEPKGCDVWEAPAIARCVFAMNPPLPEFTDRGDGLWDRWRLIHFPVRIRETGSEIRDLAAQITGEELEGVYQWALDGLSLLRQRTTFPKDGEGQAILDALRLDLDREGQFLRERYQAAPGATAVPTTDAYTDYTEWCKARGYNFKNERNFRESVKRIFPGTEVRRAMVRDRSSDISKQRMAYVGIAPVAEEPGQETDIF